MPAIVVLVHAAATSGPRSPVRSRETTGPADLRLPYLDAVIHDAELFTIGPDEVVVTFRTDDDASVTTTVGDHEITTSGPYHSARVTGLEPETRYPLAVDGLEPTELLPPPVTTLTRPAG